VLDAATLLGSVELVRALRQRGARWGPDAWALAAHAGCVALLEAMAGPELACPMVRSRYRLRSMCGQLVCHLRRVS
jgi:hypothetical protein